MDKDVIPCRGQIVVVRNDPGAIVRDRSCFITSGFYPSKSRLAKNQSADSNCPYSSLFQVQMMERMKFATSCNELQAAEPFWEGHTKKEVGRANLIPTKHYVL